MDTFNFGQFTIFENKNLKVNREKLASIRGYSRQSYVLDDSYTANRTIIYKNGSDTLVFQVIINTSIFDVIIPTSDQKFFKDKIFRDLLDYLIYMIRLECPEYSIANEAGFKLNLYVEDKTPASTFKWWNIEEEKLHDKYRWRSELVMKTSLGKQFNTTHKRILMKLEFNTSYHIKCCDVSPIKEKSYKANNTNKQNENKGRKLEYSIPPKVLQHQIGYKK